MLSYHRKENVTKLQPFKKGFAGRKQHPTLNANHVLKHRVQIFLPKKNLNSEENNIRSLVTLFSPWSREQRS